MAAKEPSPVRIERLLAAGDHYGAFAAAEELLRVAPSSAIGRFGRARALLRMGNQVEAARDLELALAASPKDVHAPRRPRHLAQPSASYRDRGAAGSD